MASRLITPAANEMARNRSSSSYGQFSFPNDLGAHAIVLNFVEYTFDRNAESSNARTNTSICLPIPSNLTDTFRLRTNTTELGQVGGMTAAGVNSFLQTGANTDQMTFAQINEAAKSALEAGGLGAMIRNATEKLDTGVIKGLEVATGKATNPHLALTFDGVDLKNHSFEWTLAPRDPSESESLARISKKIKQSILPTYATGTGRSYLKYPNAVDIFFLGTEARHLYYFKRAMVSSFTSDYAGAGSPAFLEGGAPAVVKMSMEVTEMDIHMADDYA